MGAKKPALSPAKQREAEQQAAKAMPIKSTGSDWPEWESKIERISSRSQSDILRGWVAHIPEIFPPGSPPQESIGSISTIEALLFKVPKKGDLTQPISGARPAVLREAFYLLHKAIHVQISCSRGITEGKQTWAVVDAYQSSLFALASIMGFLGLTTERDGNNFILVDVWEPGEKKSTSLTKSSVETYKFIRFKSLDHFHKWAILKRLLRTLKSRSPLAEFLSNAINDLDIKSFALHRNTVHYQSTGWLADDLLKDNLPGIISAAKTPQDLYNEIFKGTITGTVFLMCCLVELASEFANYFFTLGILKDEEPFVGRRIASRNVLTSFDWKYFDPGQ